MGFRMERTVYTLPFDGTPLAGLEIRVRSMTMEERLHVFFDLAPTAEDTPDARKAKHDNQMTTFIDHVVDWNIEDEHGEPVPVSVDGLFSVADPQQVGIITGIWTLGRTNVPAPLEQPSPGTSLSEIPMTVQESTPEPA